MILDRKWEVTTMGSPFMCFVALSCVFFYLIAASALANNCEELDGLDCAISPDCIVQLKGGDGSGYLCRAAEGPCELGTVQVASTLYSASPVLNLEAACLAKPGCAFEPGKCYCPPVPGLSCVCGGGPPPMCRRGS